MGTNVDVDEHLTKEGTLPEETQSDPSDVDHQSAKLMKQNGSPGKSRSSGKIQNQTRISYCNHKGDETVG